MTGRIEHGALPGPSPYLTKGEEEELVVFLIKCVGIGYPHTQYQVMAIVQEMLEGKGIKTCRASHQLSYPYYYRTPLQPRLNEFERIK